MKNLRVIPLLALLSIVAVLAWSRAVHADDPRTHDGFQFRAAVGPAYLSDSFSLGDGSLSGTVAGPAASLELYIGGSPIPGFTVGGFLGGTRAFSLSVSAAGQTLSTPNGSSFGLGQVGPYVDWYPSPAQGFHVLGAVGYAVVSVNNGQGATSNSGSGFGLNLGIGYDWWVSNTLSLGILGRFTYAHTTVSQSGTDDAGNSFTVNETDSQILPGVLFSLTYQ